MKTCGELIKEIRKSKQMSLRKFAEMCNLSHSYIDKLEKGVDPKTGTPVSPTIDVIRQICLSIDYPLETFLAEIGYIEQPLKDDSEIAEFLKEYNSLSNESKKELEKYIKLLKLSDAREKNIDIDNKSKKA